MRLIGFVPTIVGMLLAAGGVGAQATAVLDDSLPPGANYDKAQFRLWMPEARSIRAGVVLVPGSNGDGRAMAQDTVWQDFARRHQLAIVAFRFTDKPHDQ